MISKVYYEQIDPSISDIYKMAEFYYLDNVIGMSSEFDNDYIRHETYQLAMRNKVVTDAIMRKDLPPHVNTGSIILGISPLHKKSVLIVDI